MGVSGNNSWSLFREIGSRDVEGRRAFVATARTEVGVGVGGTGNESSSSQASYLQPLLCNVWTDTCSVEQTKEKDEIPNLDAVSSAMERQQAYLSSLNLKLCVRLLEVLLNDISRVRLHLKAWLKAFEGLPVHSWTLAPSGQSQREQQQHNFFSL